MQTTEDILLVWWTTSLLPMRSFLLNDLLTQVNTFAADVHASWSCNQSLDLLSRLATEGTAIGCRTRPFSVPPHSESFLSLVMIDGTSCGKLPTL